MNKDEKFVMEKLQLYDEETLQQPEISEELKKRLAQITFENMPAVKQPQKRRNRKVPIIATLSSVAAAFIIMLCCLLIPGSPAQPTVYQDANLEQSDLTYVEFNSSHTTLLPNADLENTTFRVYRDKESKKHVYCYFNSTINTNLLEANIVFVSNYNISKIESYENLPLSGSTSLFDYSYSYSTQTNTAYASFEHGGYKYYFKYTSDTPEKITEVISNLTLNN